jgi:hypothetical protein
MRGDRDAGITRYAVRRSGRRPETSAFSKCQLLVQPLGGEWRGRGEGSARDWRSHSSCFGAASALRFGGEARTASTEDDAGEEMGGAEGSVDRAEPAVPNRARPGWA